MKAYVVREPGSAPTLDEMEVPDPGPAEVRVRVTAASVNGFDLAVAAGAMTPFFEHRYPLVLGREFAGVVDDVGPEVTGLAVGDRVFGVVAKPHLGEGTFAEYTTAPVESAVAHAPTALSDIAAASLAHGGATALACLGPLDLDGATVLVVGATGGVGTLCVQLAAAAGARVIATARTPDGAALLRRLGATEVVPYADGLAEAVGAHAPDGVDAALHLAGDVDEIAPLVRDAGTVVSPVLYSPDQFRHDRLAFVQAVASATPGMLAELASLVDDGRLEVVVDRTFPLASAGEATAAWGHGTLGNLVITPVDPAASSAT